jgi:hypothetical protein
VELVARWAYRVVFWPSAAAPGVDRPGTISRSTLDEADHEARGIARDGGTAEVRYVTEDGRHQIVATYRPTLPGRSITPGSWRRGGALSVLTAMGGVLGLGVVVVVVRARRSRRRGPTASN